MAKLKSKEAIRKEWVKRLRSGKIKQTQSQLGLVDGSRCCLGVLCDIAVENGVIPTPKQNYDQELVYGAKSELLPRKVRMWAGLRTWAGHYQKGQNSLAQLNDNGATFKQIAKIIETEPGIFKK